MVEDEAITAMDIAQTVSDCGYEVVGIANNCADAIRIAEEQQPDIALMDIELKGDLDGITTARELRDKQIQIVFLTAYLDRAAGEAYAIASGFLGKPILREDIEKILARILTP